MMKKMMRSLFTPAGMKKTEKNRRRCITLVEVLVVVGLIVVIASIWSFFPRSSGVQDRSSFFTSFLKQSKRAAILQKSDVEILFYLKDPNKGLWRIQRKVALRPEPIHFFKEDLASGALPHTLVSPYRINERAKNRQQVVRAQTPVSDSIELEGVKDFLYERTKNSPQVATWTVTGDASSSDLSGQPLYRCYIHYGLNLEIPEIDLQLLNATIKGSG